LITSLFLHGWVAKEKESSGNPVLVDRPYGSGENGVHNGKKTYSIELHCLQLPLQLFQLFTFFTTATSSAPKHLQQRHIDIPIVNKSIYKR
jgi:hypothetical protein